MRKISKIHLIMVYPIPMMVDCLYNLLSKIILRNEISTTFCKAKSHNMYYHHYFNFVQQSMVYVCLHNESATTSEQMFGTNVGIACRSNSMN